MVEGVAGRLGVVVEVGVVVAVVDGGAMVGSGEGAVVGGVGVGAVVGGAEELAVLVMAVVGASCSESSDPTVVQAPTIRAMPAIATPSLLIPGTIQRGTGDPVHVSASSPLIGDVRAAHRRGPGLGPAPFLLRSLESAHSVVDLWLCADQLRSVERCGVEASTCSISLGGVHRLGCAPE